MPFDLAFAISVIPTILRAIGTTILVTIASCTGAIVLGLGLELARRINRPIGYLVRFVIDFIRSTPVLVQIYFLYFVLPHVGITLSAHVVGVLALSIYYSGYLAEVFKGGIDAISSGQFEASRVLGMSRFDTSRFVIGPQVLRDIAPTLGTYFISILKATPYLEVIAVNELVGQAMEVGSTTFRYAEPMLVVGIVFLVLSLSIAQLVNWLERRLDLRQVRT